MWIQCFDVDPLSGQFRQPGSDACAESADIYVFAVFKLQWCARRENKNNQIMSTQYLEKANKENDSTVRAPLYMQPFE